MHIKELFTVPEGKRVTEKVFSRVLLSSVCSILLCMACLVGTTWAWFTADIENTGNIIQIATVTADVVIKQGDNEIAKSDDGSYRLDTDTYTIHIKLDNNATDSKSPVYVLISMVQEDRSAKYYYVAFENRQNEISRELNVRNSSAVVTFSLSWVRPTSAELIDGGETVIGESPIESTTELPTQTADKGTDI